MSQFPKAVVVLSAIAASLLSATAHAAVVDPAGDFLASYTGPQAGDLDLLEVGVLLGPADVSFHAVVNGAVGATPGGFVAFGVNRGSGTPGLFQVNDPKIGAHALHDAVVLLRPNLTGTIVLIGAGGALTFTNLAPGAVAVDGDTITGVAPLDLLPANGVSPDHFTYVGWTRSAPGSNAFVADFAPGETTFQAQVPEPSAWALMILGFGAAGLALRRGRRAMMA
jgi:hypothetical protein